MPKPVESRLAAKDSGRAKRKPIAGRNRQPQSNVPPTKCQHFELPHWNDLSRFVQSDEIHRLVIAMAGKSLACKADSAF
jgi:hypothetical protein